MGGLIEPLPAFLGELQLTRFQVHSLWLSLFASLIAPFGGSFSTGVKRMHRIDRWSNVIPGHGGFLDRFDCHLLMGIFVAIYHATFVRPSAPNDFSQLAAMSAQHQQQALCAPRVLGLLAEKAGVEAITCAGVVG